MAEKPIVRKGTGKTTQLPQGAAQQLNEGIAAIPAPPEAPAPQPVVEAAPLEPVEYASAQTRARSGPVDEEEQILFAPTERKTEPITAGISARGKGPLPPDLWNWLPALVDAAVDPTAPPQLKALVQLIADRVERG